MLERIYDPVIWFSIGAIVAVMYCIIVQWLKDACINVVKRLRGGGGESNASTTPELSGRS